MTSTHLISIIVPVFNVEKYLRQCLDSLINQTYGNIEIICFNDASTDDSLQILTEYSYKDSRIKIINSLTNIKQGGGRNRAIKASVGDYICFVDSDDWVDEQFVERLYNAVIIDDSDIATADYFESKNGAIKEISHLGKSLKCSTLEIKRKILLNGCRLVTSIFKRHLFFENNLFFPEGVIYEDNAVGPALFLSASKIRKIDDPLYYYRRNESSTTNRKNNYKFFDRLETSITAIENIKNLSNYSSELVVCKEEIDWMFIKLYFLGTLFGALSMFNPIPVNIVNSVLEGINTYLPTWRSNGYYRKNVSISRKLLIKSLYCFPQITCIILENVLRIKGLIHKASI